MEGRVALKRKIAGECFLTFAIVKSEDDILYP